MTGGAEGAVLDTTALLHWPLERLAGGVCCPSQLDELERLSPARRMLVEAAQIEWMNPSPAHLEAATSAAASTGDLPGFQRLTSRSWPCPLACSARWSPMTIASRTWP